MPRSVDLKPISFDAIPVFGQDDLAAALEAFLRSAALIAAGAASQRPGLAPSAELIALSRAALESRETLRSNVAARDFFATHFRPFKLTKPGFVTAYYEPVVEARREPDHEFAVPILARPKDLVTLNDAAICGEGGEILTSARRLPDGRLEPYPDRRAIEDDPRFQQKFPIAYVRDRVELFLIQVQGSARLRFSDASEAPLTYDGRNGHRYTSVGRLLVERGLAPAAMSLETLKATIRALGQEAGAQGRLLMQENRSYVFFRVDDCAERRSGPIGGEGCALTPGRSIAIDRSLWSYGLPFWITAKIPWREASETRFERLMIAQDTGSAIIGPARADLFFGSGEGAGELAGRVRHEAAFIVLLPRAIGEEQ